VIELRDVNSRYWTLAGLASAYNRAYFVGHEARDTFRETVVPGAFSSATKGGHIELRIEHDMAGPVLASTSGKSLMFRETTDALSLGALLGKSDRSAVDAVDRIKSGELRSFSVGMNVVKDEWPTPNERRVLSADLREVSLVQKPCNDGAIVTSLRAEQRSDTGRLEFRAVPITVVTPGATTTTDQLRTPAHLLDSAISDLSHTSRHVDRLADARADPAAHDFNLEHVVSHLGSAQDHLLKLAGALSSTPSDPDAFADELQALAAMRPDVDDDEENDNGSEDRAERAWRELRRRYSDKERQALARQGKALGDGSFPIRDKTDLANAIKSIGRAKDYNRAKQHIIARARIERDQHAAGELERPTQRADPHVRRHLRVRGRAGCAQDRRATLDARAR
jgi:HK97 family phage prohead protease